MYALTDEDRASDIADFLPVFYELASRPAVETIIELGVREGTSTRAFLAGLNDSGIGHLWSVDIVQPPDDAVPEELQHLWTFVHGTDDDPGVWSRLPKEADVAFVDTDHAFEHTRRELVRCARHVRHGGLILLHDTENEHPEDHGERIGEQPPFPVKLALQWFAAQVKSPAHLDERGYGLGWITIP